MIVKIACAVLAEVIVYALLRRVKPEYAAASGMVCAAVIVLAAAGEIGELRGFFNEALGSAGLDTAYVGVLLKVLGTALVAQAAAGAARDSGQSALAESIEFAGKVLMLTLALPILKAVVQLIAAFSETA